MQLRSKLEEKVISTLSLDEVLDFYVIPITSRAKRSYLELLKEKYPNALTTPSVYISISGSENFLQTMETLQWHFKGNPDVGLWLPQLSLNPYHKEMNQNWFLTQFSPLIRSFSKVFLVLPRWKTNGKDLLSVFQKWEFVCLLDDNGTVRDSYEIIMKRNSMLEMCLEVDQLDSLKKISHFFPTFLTNSPQSSNVQEMNIIARQCIEKNSNFNKLLKLLQIFWLNWIIQKYEVCYHQRSGQFQQQQQQQFETQQQGDNNENVNRSFEESRQDGLIVLKTLHSLALLYQFQRNYMKAEQLFQLALQRIPELLTVHSQIKNKKENNDIDFWINDEKNMKNSWKLQIMRSLGALYDEIGNYSRAEYLYEHILQKEKQQQRFLTQFPSAQLTFESTISTGKKITNKGNINEDRLTLIPECSSSKLTSSHSSSLYSTMNNLALIYIKQQKFVEAEKLLFELYSKGSSSSSSSTLSTPPLSDHQMLSIMTNLANVSTSLQKFSFAEELFQQTYERKKSLLGELHPSTLLTLNNIGDFYTKQGNFEEAERIFEEYVEKQQKTLISPSLYSSKDVEDDIIAKSDKIRSEQFQHTMIGMQNLLNIYSHLRKENERIKMLWKCFVLKKQFLSEKNKETLMSLNQLFAAYVEYLRKKSTSSLLSPSNDNDEDQTGGKTERRNRKKKEKYNIAKELIQEEEMQKEREFPEIHAFFSTLSAEGFPFMTTTKMSGKEIDYLQYFDEIFGETHAETIQFLSSWGELSFSFEGSKNDLLTERIYLETLKRFQGKPLKPEKDPQNHPNNSIVLTSFNSSTATTAESILSPVSSSGSLEFLPSAASFSREMFQLLYKLGQLYERQQYFLQAENYYKQSLSLIDLTATSSSSPASSPPIQLEEILRSMSSLAHLYFHQKDYSKALDIYSQSLRLHATFFGSLIGANQANSLLLSSSTISTLSSSSSSSSLSSIESSFLLDHPHPSSQAMTSTDARRLPEQLSRTSLKVIEKQLLSILHHVTICHQSLGNEKKAKSFYFRFYQLQEKILGETHEKTLETMEILLKRYFLRPNSSGYEQQIAAPSSPSSNISICSSSRTNKSKEVQKSSPPLLSDQQLQQKRKNEFKEYSRGAQLAFLLWQRRIRVVGENDEKTLRAMDLLGELYYRRGSFRMAHSLYTRCYQLCQLIEKTDGNGDDGTEKRLTLQRNGIVAKSSSSMIEEIESSSISLPDEEDGILTAGVQSKGRNKWKSTGTTRRSSLSKEFVQEIFEKKEELSQRVSVLSLVLSSLAHQGRK